MRPVKFNARSNSENVTWCDGFLHALVPDNAGGANAVVEYVKTGEVVTVKSEDIRFEPTT